MGHGPSFKFQKKVPEFDNIELYNVMCGENIGIFPLMVSLFPLATGDSFRRPPASPFPPLRLRPAGAEAGPEQRDLRQLERHAEGSPAPTRHTGGSDIAVTGVGPRLCRDPRPGLHL